MDQSQQIETAVNTYIDGIDVPPYDFARVDARRRAAPRRAPFRLAAAALVACALAVVLIVGSPIVLAQVARILQAFEMVNGQTVPVAVNSVSLDQARHDMPFAVIAPAGIPAGTTTTINELNPSSARHDSQLVFRFSNGTNALPLTIMESRARGTTQGQTKLLMTWGNHVPSAAPPLPPSGASGNQTYVASRTGGKVFQHVEVHPISWVVRGTRIDLISPPGLLNDAQLATIRRAMSH